MKLSKEEKDGKKFVDNIEKIHLEKGRSETDLDVLYRLLQEKKVLKLSAIYQIFKVGKDTALEWCTILEEANLVTIHYPTIGDPKVMLTEKGGENEQTEEEVEAEGKEKEEASEEERKEKHKEKKEEREKKHKGNKGRGKKRK